MRLSPLVCILVSMIIVGGATALPLSANGATRKNEPKDKDSQTSLSSPALTVRADHSLYKKRHNIQKFNCEKEDSAGNLTLSAEGGSEDTSNSGNGFLSNLPFSLLNKAKKNGQGHNAKTMQETVHSSDQARKASSQQSKDSSETGGLFTLLSLPFSWFADAPTNRGTTDGFSNIGASRIDSASPGLDNSTDHSDNSAGGSGLAGIGDIGREAHARSKTARNGRNGRGASDSRGAKDGRSDAREPGNSDRSGGPGYTPDRPGAPERIGAGLPLSTSPSFADFHMRQLKNSPMTARNEALTAVQPNVLPQAARVHQDWGQIGGMTPGGLAITEPPSPNNLKTPVPGQFKNSAQTKDFVTVYPDLPTGFHTEPGPPNHVPYWYTQPAVINQVDGLTNWFAGQPNGGPNTDYQSGLATTSAAMISAETAAMANYDKAQAKTQAETQQFGDASNTASNSNLQSGTKSALQSLVNIANENSGGTYGRAVKMVQQMWRQTFLPIAILLVLPGALLTQIKGLVKSGIVGDENDEDSVSPFVGILRATIAIFLIFATQLIVSYTIDVGNSMTEVVAQQVQLQDIASWSASETSRPKGADAKAQELIDAKQSGKSAFKRAAFGFINSLFTNALVILLAYQTVMICYLYLLGPIAAAFYAWPSTTNALFKNVFTNWMNGLISLTLWRFWWSLIILCMCVRIQWLKDLGEYNPNSPWEGVVYTAFVVMLTYVPFMAFEFKPGSMVASLLEKAGQGGGGGGAGGGAGTSGDPNVSGAQPPANT
ncbi:hypothetical protein BH10CYA1_BH10CYA1_18540 [soil metagenome]